MEFETQNAVKNYVNNKIDEFLEFSCENPHLIDFMIGGNDDSLYTATSDITKTIKNLNVMKEHFNLKRQNASVKKKKCLILNE